MKRYGAVLLLLAAVVGLPGCTLGEVKTPSTPTSTSAPAAPKGWRQTGTMTVNGQVVPVYSEDYRGEGQSPYQMALNPASGKMEAFRHDEVGNVIWKMDPMEPSGQ
jgi:hypothetical protein